MLERIMMFNVKRNMCFTNTLQFGFGLALELAFGQLEYWIMLSEVKTMLRMFIWHAIRPLCVSFNLPELLNVCGKFVIQAAIHIFL